MRCPVQAFVAFATLIGGCASKPEAPQTALTGNLIVQNLTEYILSVTRIGVPLTERLGSGNRQAVNSDSILLHREHRASVQVRQALLDNILQDAAEFLRPQSLKANSDDGRLAGL